MERQKVNMVLIYIKEKEALEDFDFLNEIHSKLCEKFKNKVNSSQPLHLSNFNQYLGQVWHLSKNQTKIVLNQLSQKGLCEIKQGSGIANYFIIIKRGGSENDNSRSVS